jgi:hypothetical protein
LQQQQHAFPSPINQTTGGQYDAASLKQKRIQSQLDQLEEIKRLHQLKLESRNNQHRRSRSISNSVTAGVAGRHAALLSDAFSIQQQQQQEKKPDHVNI